MLEALVPKKEERIKEISAKLERTEKNLKMLNSGFGAIGSNFV